MTAKMTNDAVAFIRSLAELRGRNADWAEKAVREAASLSANAALQADVIDLVAARHGRTAREDRRPHRRGGGWRVAAPGDTRPAPSRRSSRAGSSGCSRSSPIPTSPFILLLVGVYGLIFEFSSPGAVAPGVVGTICLLLGLYALNLLPIDYAGLALMLLGHDLPDRRGLQPHRRARPRRPRRLPARHGDAVQGRGARLPPVLVGRRRRRRAGLRPCRLVVPRCFWRARSAGRGVGAQAMRGLPAEILDWRAGQATCCADGERWQARGDETFAPGETVEVASVDGLTLMVRRRPDATADRRRTSMMLDYLPYLLRRA